MLFLMDKGASLENTEGMIDAKIFPINYFSARTLNYFFDEASLGVAEQVKKLRSMQLEEAAAATAAEGGEVKVD
jgi:hypothetical protein